MGEGKLPNLQKLGEEGAFSKLETTQPSESPVAWASFATGVNPGKHNIFDFLVRDFDTYMPDLAMVDARAIPRSSSGARSPPARPQALVHPRRHLVLGRTPATTGSRASSSPCP